MRFGREMKQLGRLYRFRMEKRINDAELLASVHRLFENIYLDGQITQLREIASEQKTLPRKGEKP